MQCISRLRCPWGIPYLDGGHERHGNPLVQHIVPLDVLEEGVRLDLFRVLGTAAQSTLRAALQQLPRKTSSFSEADLLVASGFSGAVLISQA